VRDWVDLLQRRDQCGAEYPSWAAAHREIIMNYSLKLSSIDFILSGASIAGLTFSLTTKANCFFVSLDSTKNLPRLHIDINFGFPSLVGFGGVE